MNIFLHGFLIFCSVSKLVDSYLLSCRSIICKFKFLDKYLGRSNKNRIKPNRIYFNAEIQNDQALSRDFLKIAEISSKNENSKQKSVSFSVSVFCLVVTELRGNLSPRRTHKMYLPTNKI